MNKAKFITLDNGLTILIYTDYSKTTNHVELYNFFGGNYTDYVDYTGSKKKIKDGSAHLLEHYVCENTIDGNLIDNLRKNNILSCNAGTNSETTSYYFNTVNNFYECLEVFLNGIYNVVFTRERLNKTKMAIFSEIRDEKNDVRKKIIFKKLGGLFSINRKTLGSKSSVDNITINELKNIYDSIYIPCNQFLVVAGNFDYEKVLNIIKKFYDNMNFKCNRILPRIIDKKEIVKKNTVYNSDLMDEFILSFKIDVSNLSSFDKYKLDWYLNFFLEINFSMYSKINEYINNDSNYIDDISGSLYHCNGYYVIDVIAFTSKINEFENMVLSTINNRNIEEKELFELAKKNAITHISVRNDSICNYVSPIENNFILFGYAEEDDIDVISSFNYDEYVKIINNIDFSNYCVFYRKNK